MIDLAASPSRLNAESERESGERLAHLVGEIADEFADGANISIIVRHPDGQRIWMMSTDCLSCLAEALTKMTVDADDCDASPDRKLH